MSTADSTFDNNSVDPFAFTEQNFPHTQFKNLLESVAHGKFGDGAYNIFYERAVNLNKPAARSFTLRTVSSVGCEKIENDSKTLESL